MDASCMVRLARDWKPVEDQKRCKQTAERIDLIIPGRTVQKTEINVAGCDEVRVIPILLTLFVLFLRCNKIFFVLFSFV